MGEMKRMRKKRESCERIGHRLMTSRAYGRFLAWGLGPIKDIMSTNQKYKCFIYNHLGRTAFSSHSYGQKRGKNGKLKALKGLLGILRGKKGLNTGLNGK